MQRTVSADGGQRIEGGVTVSFLPGERQAVVHLAFCPPLPGSPLFECEVLDDSPVRLRPAEVRPYGVRIEARRTAAIEEAESVEVGFAAWLPAAAQRRAA